MTINLMRVTIEHKDAKIAELLAALAEIAGTNGGSLLDRNQAMKRIARAVIAKATGKQEG